MNREIKFRVWNKQKNEIHFLNQWGCNWSAGELRVGSENVAMQYTGLRDKNGKEIYEGDIYKIPGSNYLRYVFFHNGAFCGGRILEDSTPLNWEYSDEHDQVEIDNFVSCIEVIGNIYETPVTS